MSPAPESPAPTTAANATVLPARTRGSGSAAAAPAPSATPAPGSTTAVVEADEALSLDAYIDFERCTTCDECTNLNKKMFAYNANKQAQIKDPRAGTFQQLVIAAERCPVAIIHPGTPLNPKEKDLEKWVKRGAKFN